MMLYIVRHGECFGNVDPHVHDGPDTDLTPLGETQAAYTARRLAQLGVTHVVSSPLSRALTTAQIIADQINLKAFDVWMNLREGNHGEYMCQPRSHLQRLAPKATLPAEIQELGWLHKTLSYGEYTDRCEQIIAQLRTEFSHHDSVAVVTHGITGSNMLHALLGISWQKPMWFTLDNGSITAVRFVEDPHAERPGWELLPPVPIEVEYVNDTRHVRRLEAT